MTERISVSVDLLEKMGEGPVTADFILDTLLGMPRQSALDLTRLQVEVNEWTEKNFPNSVPHQPLLGLTEEVGELSHAHLKGEQGIRHTPEEVAAMKEDAVGDILVYLADYCNKSGIDIQTAIDRTWGKVKQRDWQADPINAAQGETK